MSSHAVCTCSVKIRSVARGHKVIYIPFQKLSCIIPQRNIYIVGYQRLKLYLGIYTPK